MPGEESPVVPKQEHHSREPSLSSIESSPDIDGEVDGEGEGEGEGHVSPPANAPVQKRKGGRKPIYATSEERKQRNRQAQAAFRERRTEYIKQLETTIKHQDETLQNLQQSHRSAADECLMLRYKNSLLERILLEKGIDVQAELKKKDLTTSARPPGSSGGLPPQAPVHPHHRPGAFGRHPVHPHPHHAHRSSTGSTASYLSRTGAAPLLPNRSPQLQPAPPAGSSQGSSPTAATGRSPSAYAGFTGGMNPPSGGYHAQPGPQPHVLPAPPPSQQSQQPQPQRRTPSSSSTASFPPVSGGPGLQAIAPLPPASAPGAPPLPMQQHPPQHIPHAAHDLRRLAPGVAAAAARPQHWPSPYRTHIEQLEQEYDAPDLLDDGDAPPPGGPDDGSVDDDPDAVLVDAYPPAGVPPAQHAGYGGPLPAPPHQQQPHPSHAGQPGPLRMMPQQPEQQPASGGGPASAGADAQMFDPYDPLLDADPFGLTASMHFPTHFSFQESSMRK